jgi:iron complex transport system substrate-binding protein
LDGIFTDIRRLGSAIDREEPADRLIQQLQHRIEQVRNQVDHSSVSPRVWVCEWLEPPMAAGHWIPELVELAGGTDGLGPKGTDSRWLTWGQIRAYDPEVIVVMPCSYSIPQTLKEKWRLTRRPGWKRLSAVRRGQVLAVEGSFYHHAGPRLVDGLELFAHLFHPDRLPVGKFRRYFRRLI